MGEAATQSGDCTSFFLVGTHGEVRNGTLASFSVNPSTLNPQPQTWNSKPSTLALFIAVYTPIVVLPLSPRQGN